jgi:hypothetical protein
MSKPVRISYSLPKIFEARRKILEEIFLPYYEAVLTGELFMRVVQAVHLQAVQSTELSAVVETCRSLAGHALTRAAAEEVAWRIAGNLQRLRAGEAVPPWTGYTPVEWVPIVLLRVRKRFRSFRATSKQYAAEADAHGMVHRRGVRVRFQVVGGLAAGRCFEQFWTQDYCETIKAAFGFAKRNRARYTRVVSRRPSYPFLDAREFYAMWLMVRLEPARCQTDALRFDACKATPATLQRNRDLIQLRLRDDYVCPEGYDVTAVPCHECTLGREQCVAACHAYTFVLVHCARCGQTAHCDPEDGTQFCIDCIQDEE